MISGEWSSVRKMPDADRKNSKKNRKGSAYAENL